MTRWMNGPCAAAMLLLSALACSSVAAATLQVERIEPPNWWVGMKDGHVQLMVHGAGIAEATPALAANGVRIDAVTRLDNPNYLLIDLSIGADARPGPIDLVFRRGQEQLHRPYELLARAPGSAQRQGYGSADVILNLVPDRFANGDPTNDDQPGFEDKARRSDLSAGRHGGDLKGIADHLDDLAAMGYTFLWPTPLVENNQPRYSYHGYAATDMYRIDPRFGSNEQYRALVAQAQAKGIGVIQDVVLNHIGSNHWWMRDMPARDWLSFDGHFLPTYHARTAVADPYAARVDRDNFIHGWFGSHMPDMNQKNPQLATYEIQNTIWWIEYAGLRGLRIDTYGYSEPDFLAAWSRRVMQEYPRLNMVGEEWSTDPVVVAHWLRGVRNADGHVSSMPGMMDFPLAERLRRALPAEESYQSGLNDLYGALIDDVLYPEPRNMVLFEGNHDMPRLFSALGEDPGLWRIAIAYVLTMPRVPQIYYGTEILLTSPRKRDDGATRQDFPGGWPGDAVNAFTGAGLSPAQKEAQDFMRRLLRWRKTQPAIHHGSLVHFAPQDGTYVYFRREGEAIVMVAINKNAAPATLSTERFREVLPAGARAVDVVGGGAFDLSQSLTVPARSVLVLEVH